MSHLLKKYLHLIISLSAFTGLIFYIYQIIVITNHGHFVYPLDDTYIHLTLARNFIQSGVLGINVGDFAFITSSPLWTGLLTFFNLIGINSELLPLMINIILGYIFIIYVYRELNFSDSFNSAKAVILLYVILSGSLVLLVFLGMEHLLHAFLFLYFILSVKSIFDGKAKHSVIFLSLITVLLALSRYESLFIIGVASSMLLFKRHYKEFIIVILSGTLPLIILGICSVLNGGFFFPTSLLLKGELFDVNNFTDFLTMVFYLPVRKLFSTPGLLGIIIVSLTIIIRFKDRIKFKSYLNILILFLSSAALHLIFAKTGWLFRYEAYMIISGLVLIYLSIKDFLPELEKNFLVLLFILISLPLAFRTYDTLTSISRASNNIYEQQWQIAGFLNEYYRGEEIAVNDIGLISYRGGVRVLDLWGLANKEIAVEKINGTLTGLVIDSVLNSNNINLAVVYKSWFDYKQGFYSTWLEAGSWEIKNNIICGDSKVTFFTKDSTNYDKLVKNLISYSIKLQKEEIKN